MRQASFLMFLLLVVWPMSLSSTGHSLAALQIIVIEMIEVYKAGGGRSGTRMRKGIYLTS